MPNSLHIPWLDDLARNLSAPQRKSMLIALTQDLRRSNQARIRDQVNTDGSGYIARKKEKAKKPNKPLRFIYNGKERVVVSYQKHGKSFTGYDQSSNKIKTFNSDRVEKWLPPPASAASSGGAIRAKKGRIKRRAMFAKIRTNRYMRIRSTSDQGRVFIAGQAGFIAKAHNFGLYSTVEKGKPWKTRYPQRELLGISEQDMRKIEATAMRYIADGLL